MRNDEIERTLPNGQPVDNTNVVPHSPYFLRKYCCHINLESVISMKSIKYVYKYIYKGHDRATMRFGMSEDEVKLYLDARYISACKALWRMYQFHMHQETPSVV